MKTRHLRRHLRHTAMLPRLAAAFFILHSAFFISRAAAQQVFQPDIPATATGTTNAATAAGAALTTADVTSGTAATATSGTLATSGTSDDDIVQMSVFNVNSSQDRGYTAATTTAGSKLNTSLKDTAAPVSVFTNEFLNDVGATTIDDMLSYGTNVEAGGGDDYGFNIDSGGPLGNNSNFRNRGMAGSTVADFVDTAVPLDLYNVDRAELASGPNSIIGGLGQPGGVLSLSTKRANVNRNTLRVAGTIGTWFNPGHAWTYNRDTLDYNIRLIPNALALRINGLYQNGNTGGGNGSWRNGLYLHTKRINPTLTIRPWKNTAINLSYEIGQVHQTISTAWNAADHITGWLDPITLSGSTTSTFNGAALDGTNKINSGGGNPYYVFNDGNGTVYDYRQALQSKNRFIGNPNQVRLPSDLSSYYYTTLGPGAWREQKFNTFQMVIEQRVGDLNLQLGYYHNAVSGISHAPGANTYDVALQGDPNEYVSGVEWLPGTGGASTVFNPNAGGLYMEDVWSLRQNTTRNDTIRLTASYSLNLKKFGRHNLVANLDGRRNQVDSSTKDEIFVDENQVAIANGRNATGGLTTSNPTSSNNNDNYNGVIRRHYVTPGDFSTYYDSDWSVPITPFKMNGHTYHAQYATRTNTDNIRMGMGAGLADQAYLFNNNLVITAGLRMDNTYIRRGVDRRLTDINDPLLLDGSHVYRESIFTGGYKDGKHNQVWTYSAGGVWHLSDRLSLFANTSTNRAADDPTGNPILPRGDSPPASSGRSVDYGVMFDLLGNNRLFLRVTHFDMTQKNAIGATNQPNVNGTAAELVTIYQAFHDAGLLLDETAPNYSAVLTSNYSRGYDGELTANLSKNFTMRLTASYTQRARENWGDELFAYYNGKIPIWMNLADPSKNGGKDYYVVDPTGTAVTLYSLLLSQLYTVGGDSNNGQGVSVRDNLGNVILQQSGGLAARPFKFNITAKYNFRSFSNIWLKGLTLGGSYRYQGPNYMPDPARVMPNLQPVTEEDHPTDLIINPAYYFDYATMIKGASLSFWDLFATYKMKIRGGRTNMTLQLNIKNIFNSNIVTEGQYRHDSSGAAFLRRVFVNEPRSIRLTATFDF